MARSFLAAIPLAAFVTAVACGSSEPSATTSSSYCKAARSAASSCESTDACDGTLATGCSNLGELLSDATVAAARDCLESGICGVASCIARARNSTKPTDAHRKLARDYCERCAPDVADCTSQFYAKRSKLPGGLVLPYAESVATAVDEACTADAETCRSTFASCATEAISARAGAASDQGVAQCITTSLTQDSEGNAPGGGPNVTTCTPENCAGCCRDERCEEGGTEASCGRGAVSCQTCSGEQKCTDGSCREPCGPTNCAGCCDGDACLPGQTTALCGGNGEACGDCKVLGAGFVCSNRQCIDQSCQVTCTNGCCIGSKCEPGTAAAACGEGGEACIRCGTGRTCNATSRECGLDPTSTWDFVVLTATIPAVNKSGSAWEFFGDPPDPYLKAFSVQGTTSEAQTATLNDTLTPSFNAATLKGIRASQYIANLSFELWDSDVDFDDFIGGCALGIVAGDFDGAVHSRTCTETGSSVRVTLTFRFSKS